MKPLPLLLFALLALPLTSAMAQDRITALNPSGSTTVDLYSQAGDAQAVRQITVGEAGLPLTIQDTQSGFHKVLIAGKEYWIRSVRVRVSRESTASCGPAFASSNGPIAATPGAGKDACK